MKIQKTTLLSRAVLFLLAVAATTTLATAGTISFTAATGNLTSSTGPLTVSAGVVNVSGYPGTISLSNGSISCSSLASLPQTQAIATCTGDYQINATVNGLNTGDQLSLSADGTIAGSISSLNVNALLGGSIPFSRQISVSPGAFNVSVGPVSSPVSGTQSLIIDVTFAMAGGSSINLPSSITFQAGTASTPEPSTAVMILLGLGAGVTLARRRR